MSGTGWELGRGGELLDFHDDDLADSYDGLTT